MSHCGVSTFGCKVINFFRRSIYCNAKLFYRQLWIIFTMTPLRIAWNSANTKLLANMRVLEVAAHITDTQPVVNFYSQKELFLALKNSCFGQLWESVNGLHVEIDIESKWVCSHIKLRYDLNQNVTDDGTQFDVTANPPWFNTNHNTNAVDCLFELFEMRNFWGEKLFWLRNCDCNRL